MDQPLDAPEGAFWVILHRPQTLCEIVAGAKSDPYRARLDPQVVGTESGLPY